MVLENIDVENKYILELALSMLYLGEGSNRNNITCYLHLRSDQNGEELKKYWSEKLKIPIENFGFTKDKRTVKSKTYSNYKGVCVVHIGKVALLRRLGFISEGFCGKILG